MPQHLYVARQLLFFFFVCLLGLDGDKRFGVLECYLRSRYEEKEPVLLFHLSLLAAYSSDASR